MSKLLRRIAVFAIILCLGALIFTGCGEETTQTESTEQTTEEAKTNNDILADGNYSQTELEELLADDSVDTITITGTIPINRTLYVTSDKTIQGTGILVYAGDTVTATVGTGIGDFSDSDESMDMGRIETPDLSNDNMLVVVQSGGKLTLSGEVQVCGNYACDIAKVENGGALVLEESANLYRGVNTGILNEGVLLISGGTMNETKGFHIYNSGELNITDGVITGCGTNAAAIYSTGTVTMSGGTIQNSANHGIYLAEGSMQADGGTISSSENDGIFVGEKASLKTTSSAFKVKNCLGCGVKNLGEFNSTAGRFMANGVANIKNYGEAVIDGGNISDASWAGILNMGTMEVHGGQITTNSYSGITNYGTFTMDAGKIYANAGPAQVINRCGTMKLIGEDVSVTAGKSVGICNDMNGELELAEIKLADQYAAHLRNWGKAYIHDITLDNNQLSSAIYNDCLGELTGENVTITNSYVHAIYNVNGATCEIDGLTVSDVGGRALQNKGGTINVKNLTCSNAVGVVVGNDVGISNRYGNVTVDGLTVTSTLGGVLNNTCEGKMVVKNAQVDSCNKAVIYLTMGTMEVTNFNVDKAVNPTGDVVHGVSLDGGGKAILNNVSVNNVTGRAIQNKGGEVEAYNFSASNTAGASIGNRYSDDDKTKNGTIYIDGLTVSNSQSGNLINECAGEITIKNGILNVSAKTNVSAQYGTINLIDTKVMGLLAEASPCINIYNDGVCTMSGSESLITGGIYRAVSVGSKSSKATFIMNGGVISGNGNENLSIYGGGVNVGGMGTFIMTGGTIKDNIGQQGGQLYIATSAVAELTGGEIIGKDPSYNDTIRIGGNDSCLALGGSIKVTGGINVHQQSGYIKVLSNLENSFVVTPYAYNSQQNLVKGEAALVAANRTKIVLEKTDSIYEIGENGWLTPKAGTKLVAISNGVEYASIEDAIAAAPTDGTLTEVKLIADVVLTERTTVTGGRNIVLTDDGTARTITRNFTSSTNNQNMMFYVYENSSLKFAGTSAGLTIKGMDDSDKTNAEHYRVIFRVDAGSKVEIADGATLGYNYSEVNGGLALIYGEVVVSGGKVTKCKTTASGTFQLAGGAKLYINGGEISDNEAKYGAAVNVSYDSSKETAGYVEISGGLIKNNKTTSAGGALMINSNTEGKITGGTFEGNVANNGASNGGAVQLANNSTLTVTGGTFTGNQALYGGAINAAAATLTISGGTFENNIAATSGSDVSVKSTEAKVTISGGTFTGENSVNVIDGGKINLSGSAEINSIILESASSRINVAGVLSKSVAATITPGLDSVSGTIILTGDATQFGKFALEHTWTDNLYELLADGSLKFNGIEYPVAKVNGKQYASVQAAIDSAPTDGTLTEVQIISDVVLTRRVAVTEGRNIVLTDDGTARTISRNFTSTEDKQNIMFFVDGNSTLKLCGTTAGLTVKGMDETDKTNASHFRVILRVQAGSKAEIADGVTLKDNYTESNGGAALIYGELVVSGGKITNCKTTKNGTLQMATGSKLYITGGEISENTATLGGVANVYTYVEVTGGLLKNNKSTGAGAALMINSAATGKITGGTFIGNVANNGASNGGAVQLANNSTLTVSGGTFTGNQALYGGAINAAAATLTISGGNFGNNTAVTAGSNLSVKASTANVTITGGIFMGTDSVNITEGGKIKLSGTAKLGTVTLESVTSTIDITGALANTAATVVPAAASDAGTVILTGTSSEFGKVVLDETWTDEDYEIGTNGALKLSATAKRVKLEIKDVTEATKYETIAEAVSAIAASDSKEGTITIKGDIQIAEKVTIGKGIKVTITDDGKAARTISKATGFNDAMFLVAGTLEVQGTGEDTLIIDGTGTTGTLTRAFQVGTSAADAEGSLKLHNGVKLVNFATTDNDGVIALVYGVLTVDGGTITAGTANNILVSENAKLALGEAAAVGNVKFADKSARIEIASALTASGSAAKITLAADAAIGDTVLTGESSLISENYNKLDVDSITLQINANGRLEQAKAVELSITGVAGTTEYNTVAEAVAAVAASVSREGTITLKGNLSLSSKVTIAEDVSIVLTDDGEKARSLTKSGSFTDEMFLVKGTLELKGTTKGVALDSTTVNVVVDDGAKLILNGNAAAGKVTLANRSARIGIASELTAEGKVATVTFASDAAADDVILTGTGSLITDSFGKFESAGDAFRIGLNGKLEAKPTKAVSAVINDAVSEYDTIAAAVEAIDADATKTGIIILNQDVELTEMVEILTGTTVTIMDDGTQRTISRKDAFVAYDKTNWRPQSMFVVTGTLNLKGVANEGLVIDGSNIGSEATRGFCVDGTLNIYDNVKITKCKTSSGAGAVAIIYGTLNMYGGTVTGNTSGNNAGAFNFTNNSAGTFSGGSIDNNNAAGHGGAIAVYSAITLSGTNFAKNKATGSSKQGGALYIGAKGEVTISDGTISENTSTGNGGGIQVAANGKLYINGGTISENDCGANYGGGVCIAASTSVVTMTGGTISGNKTTNTTRGADVHMSTSTTFTMTGGTISNTVANSILVGDKATLNIGGSAVAGNVTFAKTTSRINITSALTATSTVATVYPCSGAAVGNEILTGTGTLVEDNYTKFAVSDTTKKIGSNGKLAAND